MQPRLAVFALTISAAISIAAAAPAQERLPPTAPDAAREADVGKQYLLPPAMPAPPQALVPARPANAAAHREPWTLEMLLNAAMQNNPTLRQAQAHVSAEMGKALEAGLYPNPLLQYSGELIGVPNELRERTPGEFQGGIVQQEIVTGGKLALSRQKYIQRARISEHLAMAQQFKVLNDVRMRFYQALARSELLAIQQELLKVAEDRALTARELYNAGQARRTQVRMADIELQRARLEVLAASNEYQQRLLEMTSVAGINQNCGRVAGQLELAEKPISYEAALGRLWTESPQLAAARAKLIADQITVRREEAQWVPNLTFSGGTGYDFENSAGVSMAGLQFDVPAFDRNQGTVRQAQSDLMRQRNEVARVEWQLRMKLAEVYQRYLTAHQHLVQYEQVILPEARLAYREMLESYQANRAEWPEVLDAQSEYFRARQQYIRQLELYRVNEVLIHGFLLHDGLEAAPNPTPQGHIDSVPKPR